MNKSFESVKNVLAIIGLLFLINHFFVKPNLWYAYICRETTLIGRCDDVTKVAPALWSKDECMKHGREILAERNEHEKKFKTFQCSRGCELYKDLRDGTLICDEICFANGHCTK